MPGMVVKIGGDSTGAIASVRQLKTELSSLRSSGQVSLGGLKDALAQFQQKLLVATDPREIKALKNTISALGTEIKTFSSTGINGFQQLGTSINATISPLRTIANILPGIGIAGLVSGLISVVSELINAAGSFDRVSYTARQFDISINNLKDDLNEFKNSLHFDAELNKLALQFSGLSGQKLKIASLGEDFKETNKEADHFLLKIKELQKQNEDAASKRGQIESIIQGAGGDPTGLARALKRSGGDINKLSDDQIKNISKADQEFVREFRKTNDEIKDLSSKRVEAIRSSILTQAKIAVEAKTGDKGIPTHELRIKPEKIVIVKGVPIMEIPDITARIHNITLELLGKSKKSIQDQMNDIIEKGLEGLVVKPDISSGRFANSEAFKNLQDDMIKTRELGRQVGETLANAFGQVFDSVARGENVFKAVGEAVKELVLQLIKAAIQTAIISAIMNIFVPGSGAAAKGAGILGGLLGHATGGPVSANQPIKVGEMGTEIFVPSSHGRIVPNNSLGGLQGSANPTIIFNGQLAVSGNQLKLLLNRTDRYQASNV